MSTSTSSKWKGSCDDGIGGKDFNSKLIGVGYFNQALKAAQINNIRDSVRDTTGHGTRCASIAAENYVDGVSYFR